MPSSAFAFEKNSTNDKKSNDSFFIKYKICPLTP